MRAPRCSKYPANESWSAETFAPTRARFSVLDVFEGIVVSGTEGVMKPDPAIFELLCERYGVTADETTFIDDSATNVDSARRFGLHGIVFRDAAQLRTELVELGLLP